MRYLVSVLECYESLVDDTCDDNCWGPYPASDFLTDKALDALEPEDIPWLEGERVEEFQRSDYWVMFDTRHAVKDEPTIEVRYNWLLRPVVDDVEDVA